MSKVLHKQNDIVVTKDLTINAIDEVGIKKKNYMRNEKMWYTEYVLK